MATALETQKKVEKGDSEVDEAEEEAEGAIGKTTNSDCMLLVVTRIKGRVLR